MYEYPDWKPGGIVYNRKLKMTAHFYTFVKNEVIVLPRDGEKAGDEEYWPFEDCIYLGLFNGLTVIGG
jgi:hypothetical protein